MRPRTFPLFLLTGALLVVLAGCAGSGEAREAEQRFRREFRAAFLQYRQYEPAKSLALARGEDGRWAYGFSRGQEGQMQAVNAAKEQCERRRTRYEVGAPCQTYAVGDDITGDPALVEEQRPEP